MNAPSSRRTLWPRIQWLFEPKLTCVCLVFLFLLTLLGTLYQVKHGLFEAQQRYYNSYVLFLGGWCPFPGTQTVLGVLLLNLSGYMVNLLLAPRLRAGILAIHGGLLMMILGGAVTHHFAQESQLTLAEGDAANVTADYRDWELALMRETSDGRRDVHAVDASRLRDGETVDFGVAGIAVKTERFFDCCLVDMKAEVSSPPLSRMNIQGLRPVPRNTEPERNIAGGIFEVSANGTMQKFLLFGEEDASAQSISTKDGDYWLVLRHRRYPMPMAITLKDFVREMHPGTEMAKAFSSKVTLHADGTERDVTVSMNKPLRHRGYTFYQSSYREDPQSSAQWSTFAVVHNYGRLLPYVSTALIVLGMIWHFGEMLLARARKS